MCFRKAGLKQRITTNPIDTNGMNQTQQLFSRIYDLVCFKKSTIESRENPDVSAAIIFVDGTCGVMNKVGVCSMYVLRHVKERANWLKSLNTKQPPEKKRTTVA